MTQEDVVTGRDPLGRPQMGRRSDFRTVDDPGPEVFQAYPVASWAVAGNPKVAFPVKSIHETGGNRIVRRERPFRNGAKLDDTGGMPKTWTFEAFFHNAFQFGPTAETGLREVNGNVPLYPDVLNALIDSFSTHETGDLVVPTRGVVRARAESYNRMEGDEDRDWAALSITFVEDNEDGVDAASFTAPTANANAAQLAGETVFSAQSDGAWDFSILDLKNALSQIEGIANAPIDMVRDLESQALIVQRSVERTNDGFRNTAREGRDILSDPQATKLGRDLEDAYEMAGKAIAAARRGRPPLISVFTTRDTSLPALANALGQDFQSLLDANAALANPLFVPRGTYVWVLGE